MVYENGHKNVLAIWLELVSNVKIWAHSQKIKQFKNQSYQNMYVINKSMSSIFVEKNPKDSAGF